MTGKVTIAGLGPGADNFITPSVAEVVSKATDVIGYIPYVQRITPRQGLTLHATDNRVERERAAHALDLAADGKQVVVVSLAIPAFLQGSGGV